MLDAQRLPSEKRFESELNLLIKHDKDTKPDGWKLSPKRVKDFILGTEIDGKVIPKKIYGNDDNIEKSIVTLMGQRGLLLAGAPGTAKSLLSELLAAAICGNSKYTIQGSAGIVEENIRYSWNYALLLKTGPTLEALIPGPLFDSMQNGSLMRFEEITRCPTEVQDNLIPIMSDKILHIPEIKDEDNSYLLCKPGFNIIATANLKDRGVNEMSSALKRRFNFVNMRPLQTLPEQVELIQREVNQQLEEKNIDLKVSDDVALLIATTFKELKEGISEGVAIDPPSTILSMAEAVSVVHSAAMHAHYFGNKHIMPSELANQMVGAVIKDDEEDQKRFEEYLRVISRKKKTDIWQSFSSFLRR